MASITVTVADADQSRAKGALGLLVPKAIDTDHQRFLGLDFPQGWQMTDLIESTSGQQAVLLIGNTATLALTYHFKDASQALTPDDYARFDNRYTRASLDLKKVIAGLRCSDGLETAQNIITHTAGLFDYGHPEDRFNDGHDSVPVIACGTAKGSCVDINTYLISAFTAADVPVVYFAGYFFPKERGGITNDMHCWISTWVDGAWLDWDVAHHMKMGLGPEDIRPGYNPRPGQRQAITYGRGLQFPIGDTAMIVSHFGEPLWVYPDGKTEKALIEARIFTKAIENCA